MKWGSQRDVLLRRLPPGRADLGPVGLYERYWAPAGLPRARVLALLGVLELEYDLPVGHCRPEDRLRPLYAPAPSRSPLRRLAHRLSAGGARGPACPLDELLWAHGARPAAEPETLDDLVRAWCGGGGE